VLLGGVAAVSGVATSPSTVYATASTQMLVDSPNSALSNASVDLTGYLARAGVFARLMTSGEALQYIGKAAGINGNLIAANGPVEINGSPTATHAPVAITGGKDLPAPATYELSFVQNPSLPTVDVYAQAPTTKQAIALANGAVTGFASFMTQLKANNVPAGDRVEVRQLGPATGAVVDPSAGKSIAVLVFLGVLAIWCCLILFVSRLRTDLRATKRSRGDEFFPSQEPELPPLGAPFADGLPQSSPALDAHHANEGQFHRSPGSRGQSGTGSNGRTFVRP
jgi:hypothetical protein